jgi:hypothetical protein
VLLASITFMKKRPGCKIRMRFSHEMGKENYLPRGAFVQDSVLSLSNPKSLPPFG